MWVFWAYFPSTVFLTCDTGLLAFQRQLLLSMGVVLKRTEMFVFVVVMSFTLSPLGFVWLAGCSWA